VKNPNPFRAVQFDIPSDVYSGFYDGVANDLLWPALHGDPVANSAAPVTDEQWKQYETANSAYADVAVSRLKPGRPNVVWIHDYQLLLAPGMIRDKSLKNTEASIREDTRIGYFQHIPSAEPFSLIKRLGTVETGKTPEAEEIRPEVGKTARLPDRGVTSQVRPGGFPSATRL
jgi:trehalose-6-phosphate synthase